MCDTQQQHAITLCRSRSYFFADQPDFCVRYTRQHFIRPYRLERRYARVRLIIRIHIAESSAVIVKVPVKSAILDLLDVAPNVGPGAIQVSESIF